MADDRSFRVKNRLPRVGIDLLGSDTAEEAFAPAVIALFQELHPHVHFTVFCTQPLSDPRIHAILTDEVITMEDDPLHAIRRKKNSSLCQGIRMLQEKKLDAFISAGNTGALIAYSVLKLPLLPSIERPALLTLLPTKERDMAVLDVGAGVTSSADQLVQFAHMGIAYQKSRGIEKPTLGLLNNGTEEGKGTQTLQEAYKKLQQITSAQFLGNIEGKEAFAGNIDILVTDGFTGNIFLKTAEGIAAVILDQLEENAGEECSPQLKNVLSILRQRLYYAEYPGALLAGIDGIVIKCHGDSPPQALVNGIKGAIHLIQDNFLEKIKSEIQLTIE